MNVRRARFSVVGAIAGCAIGIAMLIDFDYVLWVEYFIVERVLFPLAKGRPLLLLAFWPAYFAFWGTLGLLTSLLIERKTRAA